ASLQTEALLWRRPDAAEPLRFSRKEIREISFVRETNELARFALQFAEEDADVSAHPRESSDVQNLNLRPTVQLGGRDWLRGELSSADGITFSIEVNRS